MEKGQLFLLEAIAAVVLLSILLATAVEIHSVDNNNWELYQSFVDRSQDGALVNIYDRNFVDMYSPGLRLMHCYPFWSPGTPPNNGDLNPNRYVWCAWNDIGEIPPVIPGTPSI